MTSKRSTVEDNWLWINKIPLAIVLVVLAQGAGLIAWNATMAERVKNVELKHERIEAVIPQQQREQSQQQREQGDRLTKVEVKLDNAIDGIREIKSLLTKPK